MSSTAYICFALKTYSETILTLNVMQLRDSPDIVPHYVVHNFTVHAVCKDLVPVLSWILSTLFMQAHLSVFTHNDLTVLKCSNEHIYDY